MTSDRAAGREVHLYNTRDTTRVSDDGLPLIDDITYQNVDEVVELLLTPLLVIFPAM